MAKKPSKTSPHKSGYGAGYVNAAKYLAELICIKCADQKKEFLTDRFWEKIQWKIFYKQQCMAARALLKLYSVQAIIKALNDKKSWGIYSLRSPLLDNIIMGYQKVLDEVPIVTAPVETTSVNEAPRKITGQKSLASKLRGL